MLSRSCKNPCSLYRALYTFRVSESGQGLHFCSPSQIQHFSMSVHNDLNFPYCLPDLIDTNNTGTITICTVFYHTFHLLFVNLLQWSAKQVIQAFLVHTVGKGIYAKMSQLNHLCSIIDSNLM